MIVNDEARQAKVAQWNRLDDTKEKSLLSCAREVKDSVHVPRMANAEARLGRAMMPSEFEQRLLRIDPNFYFEVIENNPTKKRLSYIDQRGKFWICVYENALMPERSIAKVKEMVVPDPNYTGGSKADFSKDPDAIKPGWRKVQIPWGEYRRGWRTVLVKLIQVGLITTQQAEAEFGSDETPEWRQHTGKGEYTTPF